MQSFMKSATHKMAAGISEENMLADVTSVQLPLVWFCLALTGECCGCLLYIRLPLFAGGVCGQSKVLFLGHRQRVCLFLLITVLAVSLYSWEEVGTEDDVNSSKLFMVNP